MKGIRIYTQLWDHSVHDPGQQPVMHDSHSNLYDTSRYTRWFGTAADDTEDADWIDADPPEVAVRALTGDLVQGFHASDYAHGWYTALPREDWFISDRNTKTVRIQFAVLEGDWTRTERQAILDRVFPSQPRKA